MNGADTFDDEKRYGLVGRAGVGIHGRSNPSCNAALADAERAQELAPHYALPKAIAAWCWSQRAAHNFSDTPDLDRAKALHLAGEAARLAPHDALGLSLCSGA